VSKRSIVAVFVVIILLSGAAYLWVGSATPSSQDPLSTLTPSSLGRFEESFDKSSAGFRLVLLLSPT